MNLLWITNIPPRADIDPKQGAASLVGGWVTSVADLLEGEDIRPTIAFPSREVGKHGSWSYDAASRYIRFSPAEGYTEAAVAKWRHLIREHRMDAVHLFGTELPHSAAAAEAARAENVCLIVTIQGLVSIIAEHMTAGLTRTGLSGMTVRSLVRHDSVRGLQSTYEERAIFERRTLKLANFVIGRTEWDSACAQLFAPDATYVEIPETLREPFYRGAWEAAHCRPYSIFMSQASNPLKGLHFALRGLATLKQRYPAVHLTVAGRAPARRGALQQRILGTQYGVVIRDLISSLGLEDAVRFAGPLDAEEMRREYLVSNVFLSASSIENESNSLSEAKALGVPAVASYVGGVASRLDHGVTGYLYQHDAPYMMAHFVSRLFDDPDAAQRMGRRAQHEARTALDPKRNLDRLRHLYEMVEFDGS